MIRAEHEYLNEWWAEKKAKLAANRTRDKYSDWILDYWRKLPVNGGNNA